MTCNRQPFAGSKFRRIKNGNTLKLHHTSMHNVPLEQDTEYKLR